MSQENLKLQDKGKNKTELTSKFNKVISFSEESDDGANAMMMGEDENIRMNEAGNNEYAEYHYDEEIYGESLKDESISGAAESKKKKQIKLKEAGETVVKARHKITLMTPSLLDLDDQEKPNRRSTISSTGSGEYSYGEELEEVEEEHEEHEEEIEDEMVNDELIDREAYLELYQKLTDEKKILRRRNAYLHRKMTEHLKKRNLESFLKEPSYVDSVEVQERYEKKLILLAKKLEWNAAQKEKLTEELELMRKEVNNEQNVLDVTFEDFLKREREISFGLIDTSTGQPISDRVKLLNLQKQKFETIGEIRLECIRLRDKVNKKEKILESIETIGDNLHLVDYEYLYIENQNFTDKNEERDDELSKLHNKSAASVQILAHIRQKSYATAVDFQVMEEKLKEVETQLSETRENLNTLKIQRDNYRSEALRLKESSGLLTQMKLLHDFECTNEEIVKARAELESIKKKFDVEQEELHQLQSLLNAYGEDKKSAH